MSVEAPPAPVQVTPETGNAKLLHRTLSSPWASFTVIVITVLWTIPTFGLLVTSFRPEKQIKTTGWWTFFAHPEMTLQNYHDVLFSGSNQSGALSQFFVNSLVITIPGTLVPLLVAALAAYALAWVPFKGRDYVFLAIFALQVVPIQLALIPLLQLFSGGAHLGSLTIIPNLHLANTFYPVWIAHAMFAMPLAIFLLHNFMAQLPRDLMEAAEVDGATHTTTFRQIVLPLSLPALASFAIFQFLWVWNDLLVALTFAGGTPNTAPLTVRLQSLTGTRGNDWQLLSAGAFISIVVPLIVFFSLQRYFVRGLLAGSVKG